jgi:hypothetical protein
MKIFVVYQSEKLPHLIRFWIFAIRLNVEVSRYVRMLVNMIAAICPHQLKTKRFGETAQFIEARLADALNLNVKFGDAGY